MAKRLLSIVISLIIISGCFFGCTFSKKEKIGKLSVVTTIFPPYDFAKQICGDTAEVTMLLKPGGESHSYEPTPQDIIKIQESDIFIYTGGESDEWVNDILDSLNTDNMKIVTLMDCVNPFFEEIKEGMQTENDNSYNDRQYDEHIWTSPVNAIRITEKICDALISVNSSYADVYKSNALEYSHKLNNLDESIKEIVDSSKRKTLIFGDRFPFLYLTKEYGLDYYAAFPGCSSETEPSAATVAFLIDKVKDENIPVVFYIEFSNEKIADTICQSTGAKKLLLHSCHNVSKQDFENNITYLELMKKNIESVKEALN